MTIDYDHDCFYRIEAVIVIVISHCRTTIQRLNEQQFNNLLFILYGMAMFFADFFLQVAIGG